MNIRKALGKALRAEKHRSDEQGAVLVEMAFALPMFFALLFATIQFSLILFNYCNAAYACRLAVRYASLHSNQSENPATYSVISGIVTQNLFLVGSENATVEWCYNSLCNSGQATAQNNVGAFAGVGVLYSQFPWWGKSGNVYFTATAYRTVTR